MNFRIHKVRYFKCYFYLLINVTYKDYFRDLKAVCG